MPYKLFVMTMLGVIGTPAWSFFLPVQAATAESVSIADRYMFCCP